MKTCVLCGNEAGWFPKKSYSGYLCKDCLSLIPSNVQLSSADADYLKTVTEKSAERKKRFKCTAFYGSLFIDEVNNMFCISRRRQGCRGSRNRANSRTLFANSDRRCRGGEPLCFGDTYYIAELEEVGLSCSNVRNVGTHTPRILCDVKIRVKSEGVLAEYSVVSGEPCTFKRVEDGIEWYEPAKLSMFRSLFNQMIDNEYFDALHKLKDIKTVKAELSKPRRTNYWARGVFFFDEEDEITEDALKKRRKMLTKLFHPDVSSASESDEIMAQINEAFQILSKK